MPELTDRQELIERIRQESQRYLSAEPQAGEFTVKDYMEINGIEYDQARQALAEMEKDGKLTRRKGRQNGSSCNVYRFTDALP